MQKAEDVDVDKEPVRDAGPAVERAHDTDRAPDLKAQITALVRLLARPAAREHLDHSTRADTKDVGDER
jgi:hypothetical protein